MPQALAVIAPIATLGGGIMSGISASNQADYQAAVAQRNASITQQAAKYQEAAGSEQEQQQLLKTAGFVSAQKAAQGSSGLDVNTGSGVAVRASSAALGDLSALEIRSNTARAVYGDQIQEQADLTSAANYRAAGENQLFGSILGGVGQAGGLAGQLMQTGALPTSASPSIGP